MSTFIRITFAALALLSAQVAGAQTLTISGPSSVTETDSDFTRDFTVRRDGDTTAASGDITITLGTDSDNDTANAAITGNDADVTVPATVNIPVGQSSITFQVTIEGDQLNEARETFTITTSGGSFTHPTTAHVVTINDDDPVSVTISGENTVEEGSAYTITATPNLNGNTLSAALTVNYTLGGSGIVAADFNPASLSGVITISATTTVADTDDVTIVDNENNQASRTFTVSAEAETAGRVTLTDNIGNVTITDDDTLGAYITIGTAAVPEADPATAVTATVTLTKAPTRNITVNYSIAATAVTTDDDAENNDLSRTSGSINFASGVTTGTIEGLTVVNDNLNEPAETFTIAIAANRISGAHGTPTVGSVDASNVYTADTSGSVATDAYTIAASDPIVASITNNDADGNLNEGDSVRITVDFGDITPTRDISIVYAITGTVADADYNANPASPLVIRSGQRRGDISIRIENDSVNEDDETLIVTILAAGITGGHGTAATIDTTTTGSTGVHTFNIPASDTITYAISGDRRVSEGDANTTVDFTVSLSGAGATAGSSYTMITVAVDITGTATATADYTAPASVAFNLAADPPELRQTFTVTVVGDNVNEAAEETVILTLGATDNIGSGGDVEPRNTVESATLTITDDDNISVAITGNNTVAEGGRYIISATPTLNGNTLSADLVVNYTIAGNDVVAADFMPASLSGSVTIPMATTTDTAVTDTFTVMDNDNNEPSRTFTVAIAHAADPAPRVTLNDNIGTVTITDDDPIEASIAIGTAAVSEGGNATATVTLGVIPSRDIRVAYRIVATDVDTDTDATNADFGRTDAITIAADTPVADGGTITVAITDDNLNEPAETFTIAITAGGISGAYGTPTVGTLDASNVYTADTDGSVATGVYTIAPSDPITAALQGSGSGSVVEGDTARVTVDLGVTANADIAVAYTLGGTAVAADYTDSASGSITIGRGRQSGTISIGIVDDSINEAAETLTVAIDPAGITGGVGAMPTVTGSPVTFTIAASDPVTYAISGDQRVTEAAATTDPAITAVFTITLSDAIVGSGYTMVTVPVNAATTGTTATATADYTAPANVVFNLAGPQPVLRQTFTVTVVGDNVNEPTETLILNLGTPTTAGTGGGEVTPGRTMATLTIEDDDTVFVSLVGGNTARVDEGDSVMYELQLSGGERDGIITVRYSIHGVSSEDYTDTSGGVFTVPAGTALTHQLTSITINVDSHAESDETLTVSLDRADAANGGRVQLTGSVRNDNIVIARNAVAGRVLVVTAGETRVDEGGTSSTVTFTVTPTDPTDRTNASPFTAATVLRWRIVHDRTDNDDFTAVSGDVNIAAGAASAEITVTVANDELNEPDERFRLRVDDDVPTEQGRTAGGNSPQVNIDDDDDITVTLAGNTPTTTVAEGSNATISVDLGKVTTSNVTVFYRIGSDGDRTTVNAGVDDYTDANNGRITIPRGMQTGSIVITTVDDELNEASEVFTVAVTDVRDEWGDDPDDGDPHTVTITDNDAILVSFVDASPRNVVEGASLSLAVMLDHASADTVTVNFTAGTTASPTFTPRMGSITIAAGERSGTITVSSDVDPINNDPNTPASATVTITGVTTGAPGRLVLGGVAAPDSAADTVTVNVTYRVIPRSFRVERVGTGNVQEGDTVMFRITLTATSRTAPTTQATVAWSHDGADTVNSGTVTLSNGSSRDVPVDIATDDDIEGTETLTFRLSTPAGGYGDNDTGITGAPIMVMVTDNSSRMPTVTLSGPTSLREVGGETPIYTVTLSQTPLAAVDVTWRVVQKSIPDTTPPRNYDDFEATDGTVTIAVGQRAATFMLERKAVRDSVVMMRTFELSISLTSGETAGGSVPLDPEPRNSPLTVSIVQHETDLEFARRSERLKAPLESVARSIGQMTAGAIGERLRASDNAGGNSLTIGGRAVTIATAEDHAAATGAWADDPHRRSNVHVGLSVSGGEGKDLKELLADTSFALSLSDGGTRLWAAGGRIKTDGDKKGVRYNSESTGWHVGADRKFGGGIYGVALAQTDSEVDIDDFGLTPSTADNVLGSKLTSAVVTVHPYITREMNGGARVWATFGLGSGDAELHELRHEPPLNNNDDPRTTIDVARTTMDVFTAGIGAEYETDAGLKLHLSGLLANARLRGAAFESGQAELSTVTGRAMRVNGGVEGGVTLPTDGGGTVRPFILMAARADNGDGHDGTSLDWGGGVDAHSGGGLYVRVEGRWQVDGGGPDEESLSIIARQEGLWAGALAPYARMDLDGASGGLRWQRGQFGLSMEVGVDDDGVGLKRLISGGWLF